MLREFFTGLLAKLLGARPAMMNAGIDAARVDDGWMGTSWPTLDSKQEVDSLDRDVIWRRARMLYMNCPPIRHAVNNMVTFTGQLQPLPRTQDEEWNELARAAFMARTKNPFTFDVAGKLSYTAAQDYLEMAAIVDGEVYMMPCIGPDGGAMFAFYRAPQVAGGGDQGVEVDRHNRAVAYYLMQPSGKPVRVPAWQMVHYAHGVDPCALRHESELVAAIRHGQDIRQIVGYTKAGIKMAAQFGLVETSEALGPYGAMTGAAFEGGGSGARKNVVETPSGPRYLADTGMSITTLLPGHKMQVIADQRPSQQVMEFVHFLVQNIAWSVGLDKEMLFYGEDLASAGTRLNLEKLKRWQGRRRADKEVLCNRIWVQVIALEVAAGRLRPCKDAKWKNVTWVAPRDMTIDLGRETAAHLALAAKGLDDMDAFCLSVHGKTYARLIEEKAHNLAHAKEVAAEYGLDVGELIEAAAGATVVPSKTGGKGHPVPKDDDPEE